MVHDITTVKKDKYAVVISGYPADYTIDRVPSI